MRKLNARIIYSVLKIFHSIDRAPLRNSWMKKEPANCALMASFVEPT